MVGVQCSQLALAKIVCHAAKHLSSTINGVLLGTVGADGVVVTDAIPMFHTPSVNLAAPTEIALAQISAHTEEVGTSYGIVGYYQSEARFAAAELTAVGRKVADKLASRQPAAVVLVLDNKKLGTYLAGEDTQPFELFTRDGSRGGWTRAAAAGGSTVTLSDSNWKSFLSEVNRLLKQRLHSTLADFDDHLDDASKDYLNPHLKELGKFKLPGQA